MVGHSHPNMPSVLAGAKRFHRGTGVADAAVVACGGDACGHYYWEGGTIQVP